MIDTVEPHFTPHRLDPPGHALWCEGCGQLRCCITEEMLRFAEEGWPRCCDEVMSLHVARPA